MTETTKNNDDKLSWPAAVMFFICAMIVVPPLAYALANWWIGILS